eukprot:Hpha_TRINITY_DN14193_c0_g1::TRINITY_DN14193_c0_g1_i1::g.10757::m.10757
MDRYGKVDYEEAGKKLLERVGLEGASARGKWSDLDPLYKHPTTGAQMFVGNIQAAQNKSILQRHNISHVVNCQERASKNFHEGDPGFHYLRFFISGWWRDPKIKATPDGAFHFFGPVFMFIDSALADGQNVMVHCLAGAHRAGTTGCAYLMHAADLNKQDAVMTAKRLRPIIDPIGDFPELLHLLQNARDHRRGA